MGGGSSATVFGATAADTEVVGTRGSHSDSIITFSSSTYRCLNPGSRNEALSIRHQSSCFAVADQWRLRFSFEQLDSNLQW